MKIVWVGVKILMSDQIWEISWAINLTMLHIIICRTRTIMGSLDYSSSISRCKRALYILIAGLMWKCVEYLSYWWQMSGTHHIESFPIILSCSSINHWHSHTETWVTIKIFSNYQISAQCARVKAMLSFDIASYNLVRI